MPSHLMVILPPNGMESTLPLPKDPDARLKMLQTAVGGTLESIKVRHKGRIRQAYACDTGVLDGLPHNAWATWMHQQTNSFATSEIYGPIAIIIPIPKP